MKSTVLTLLVLLCANHGNVQAQQSPADNPEMLKIFELDQADRGAWTEKTDFVAISARDEVRRSEVKHLLQEAKLRSAADFRHAAFVFQHGDEPEDYRRAFALGTIATMLSPNDPKMCWIRAAAWDRLMMSLDKPQWYGTQYVGNPDATKGGQILYNFDALAVSDDERVKCGIKKAADISKFYGK